MIIILRIICFIIIFLSSTAIGFYYADAGQRKINGLLELKKAFIMLKSEIEFKKAGLKDAFLEIADKTDKPVNSFFKGLNISLTESRKPIYIVFTQELQKLKSLNLTKEETNQFISFSKTFGLLDKALQRESLDFFIHYIEEQLRMYTEKQKKTERLFKSLGMILGILIIIILI